MPVTITVSLKATWIGITVPTLYVPFAVVAVISVTVGSVLSITIFLLCPKELVAPGLGRVKAASLFAESFIVPPLRVREPVVE